MWHNGKGNTQFVTSAYNNWNLTAVYDREMDIFKLQMTLYVVSYEINLNFTWCYYLDNYLLAIVNWCEIGQLARQ